MTTVSLLDFAWVRQPWMSPTIHFCCSRTCSRRCSVFLGASEGNGWTALLLAIVGRHTTSMDDVVGSESMLDVSERMHCKV